ncbi:MAG: hypothetical protein CVT49_05365 [candidate division Zixibacteria bacterium HGW-Zixibacteria-1]|nr:MAG: hypothetical protein CVT49_05365 [candidate division Zixibacteria bacterium HGW-Zixibacteria-1]
MNKTTKEYLPPLSITIVLLVISLILHLKSCGSPMTADSEVWRNKMDYHLNHPPMSIRFFTTYLILLLSNISGLPHRESFYIIQFGLAVFLGPVFYRFLKQLGFEITWSNVGVVLLMSSYSIMAAHFEPVHTWDDFWVYLFLILSFLYLIRGRNPAGIFFFILACLARESTTIFYPAVVLAVFQFSRKTAFRKKMLYLLTPLIICGIYYLILWQDSEPERVGFIYFNFANRLRASDSIFSFFISFGFAWVAVVLAWIRLAGSKRNSILDFLFCSSIIMLALNTIMTVFFTHARETRIFFPPFLFVYPLVLIIIRAVVEYVAKSMTRLQRTLIILFIPILIAAGIWAAYLLFPTFEYRQCANYCRQWAGINFAITALLIFIWTVFPAARIEFDIIISQRFGRESINDF